MNVKIETVQLERIELHPMNRKRLGNLKELQADIATNGIEVPLIGRWLTTAAARECYPKRQGDAPLFQVLAGARRMTVARNLEFDDVTVIVREDLNDTEAFRFLMRENLHRADVHPLDEALYFDQWIVGGANVEMIAAEVGKEMQYVHRRLQLLRLIEGARTMYEKDVIGAGVAMELARIPEEAQQEALKWIRDRTEWKDSVSVADVKHWVRGHHLLLLSRASFSPKDADLWPPAGPCTTCPKRTGFTPSLFGDLTEKDSCTDRLCWEQKALKRIEQRVKEFQSAAIKWTPLGDWSYMRDREEMFEGRAIMGGNMWEECKQKEKDAMRGLMVRTRNLDELGKCMWIRLRTRASAGIVLSAQAKAINARQARVDKVRTLHRSLVFDAIREAPPVVKITSSPQISFLQRVAVAFWDRLWSESQKKIAQSYGWELKKQKAYSGWDMERTGHERIAQMRPGELVKFLEVLTLGHTIVLGLDNSKNELLEHAKRTGIDVAQLKRQAENKYPTVKTAKKTVAKKKARQRVRAKSKDAQ